MDILDNVGLEALIAEIKNRSMPIKALTQAEYNALSAAEKNKDILYVIRDYDASIFGIPSGVITMWSGAADAIPSGWAICNGENGTPNLSSSETYKYIMKL